jgi:hypothetical protein
MREGPMISFWTDAAGAPLMTEYLRSIEPAVSQRITLRSYESLANTMQVHGGPHIFAALDQLGPHGRAAVAALADALMQAAPGITILNDPRRARRRAELLRDMYGAGINTFQARRAGEGLDGLSFPVFVREEAGHNGSLTGLLTSPRELSRALIALRVRGFRMADLLVVERCDLADADGVIRTASAFRLGNEIIPSHLLRGRHWMLKWDGSDHGEQAMREHLDYLQGNPHEPWLRRVFTLAGIDFGRIDYGVGRDGLQVWEINLHPTLALSPDPETASDPSVEGLLQQGRQIWRGGLERAFLAIDAERADHEVTVRLDPSIVARARTEMRRADRRNRTLRFLRAVYSKPVAGWLFRQAYALFPRPQRTA